MRIIVYDEGEKRLNLRLPTRLLLNPVTAAICAAGAKSFKKKYHIGNLPFNQLRRLFKELRRCRKYLNGRPLVDIKSSDGTSVEIWI